jgi:Skp family chaperone for outer membrane proteins
MRLQRGKRVAYRRVIPPECAHKVNNRRTTSKTPERNYLMNARHLIASAILAAFVAPVMAQTTTTAPVTPGTNTPVIDKRVANQEKRIAEGQASGQLTNKEAANLDKREAKLNNDIAKAKSDGTVTKAERKKLRHEENRDSRKIARKKHNAKTATTEAAPAK